MFNNYLRPTEHDRILDLGSDDGSHIAHIIPFRRNVYIADISHEALNRGKEKYGFNTILLNESGEVPVLDQWFDIVYSSSVIEHVTVKKKDIFSFTKEIDFTHASFERQKIFADELRRVGKRYFVQTPYKYFFIETHTWLPVFYIYLPRRLQIKIIKFNNSWWIKRAIPDFNLLTKRMMHQLFPEAEILSERFLGFTKSLIAIKA